MKENQHERTILEPTRPAPSGRRLPYLVYVAGIVIVVAAFLLEIVRGNCPV